MVAAWAGRKRSPVNDSRRNLPELAVRSGALRRTSSALRRASGTLRSVAGSASSALRSASGKPRSFAASISSELRSASRTLNGRASHARRGFPRKLSAVLRTRKYLVELPRAPELEEFGCRAELVARPDQNGQCDNLVSVFLKFERYLTIHFAIR